MAPQAIAQSIKNQPSPTDRLATSAKHFLNDSQLTSPGSQARPLIDSTSRRFSVRRAVRESSSRKR